MKTPDVTDVLIVGGGPCGLMLANELGRRGVTAIVVDDKPSTAFNPQANATQARTMEHFRRLGFADEVRAIGLPPEYPTDIVYFTRFAKYELARFRLPSAREAKDLIRGMSGSWSAAELPHRVSQKYVEAILRRHAEALPGVSVRYGWKMTEFTATDAGVEATTVNVASGAEQTIRARWMLGADGPRSFVRERLGFGYVGESGKRRDFMGGRMLAIYMKAPDFYRAVPHAQAWMHVSFNSERRSWCMAVDGKEEFAFHTQLQGDEERAEFSPDGATRLFHQALGAQIPITILAQQTWTAGHALVADGFQRGNIFLGGDAVHLFTPAGGLGYNTAIEDAVNLGWKIAALKHGQGGPSLLASYQAERQPVARRNTSFAREFADSLSWGPVPPGIEGNTPQGLAARAEAGVYFSAHARREFNIPGVTFGARYDGSPIIVADGTRPPPDAANQYEPTACPGGRAPHVWLADGRSLFDSFGFGWTLLRLDPNAPDGGTFRAAAGKLGVDLEIVSPDHAGLADLYEAPLALIRPDQIVAWRGANESEASDVMRHVLGHTAT